MSADKELIELIERLAEDAFNEGWRDRESRSSPRHNSRAAMRTAWRGSNARDAILNPIGEAAARLEALQPSPETSLQNMQTRGAVGREDAVDLRVLDEWFSAIPEGPYDALHTTIGWEVRQLDTDQTNKHHWPFRLCSSVAGQTAGCDEDVFNFIAGVINVWPSIRDALFSSSPTVEGGEEEEGSSQSQPVLSHKSDTDGPCSGGWRDIATAPMNGRDILITTAGIGMLVRIGFWDEARGGVWSVWPGREQAMRPTHWMPLPIPPESSAADGASSRHTGQLRDEQNPLPAPTTEGK